MLFGGADAKWSGVYRLTDAGANDPGGRPAQFTRRTDFWVSGDFATGAYVPRGASETWMCVTQPGFTLNSNAIRFVPLSASIDLALPLSALPAAAAEGQRGFATDGRKAGEGVGAGTGVPCYYSNGAWRCFSTDAAVTT